MPRSVQADDNWGERVAKLLPAEATAMFVTIHGFINSSSESLDTRTNLTIAAIVIVTLCVPLYLIKVYKVESLQQVMLCTASFPLWATNISPRYVAEMLTMNAATLQLYVSIGTVLAAGLGPIFLTRQPLADP